MFKALRGLTPRLRPRRVAFRILTTLLCLQLFVLVTGSVNLWWNVQQGELSPPWFLLMVAVLTVFVVGAQFHAYLGGPKELGAVAAPAQLWRRPALRTLPELPPLAVWKIALCYLVPLATTLGFLAWLWPSFSLVRPYSSQEFWRQAAVDDMEQFALEVGFIRVGCQRFPRADAARSLCFIVPPEAPPMPPRPLPQALPYWIGRNLSWLEIDFRSRDMKPTRHPVQAPELAFQQGGGVLGLTTQLSLPVVRGAGQAPKLGPFQLEAWSVSETSGSDPVPPAYAREAAWLRQQVFNTYFVVTPLTK